eukprot:771868-Prymnesium_polylepis.2
MRARIELKKLSKTGRIQKLPPTTERKTVPQAHTAGLQRKRGSYGARHAHARACRTHDRLDTSAARVTCPENHVTHEDPRTRTHTPMNTKRRRERKRAPGRRRTLTYEIAVPSCSLK